eukprot:151814_1
MEWISVLKKTKCLLYMTDLRRIGVANVDDFMEYDSKEGRWQIRQTTTMTVTHINKLFFACRQLTGSTQHDNVAQNNDSPNQDHLQNNNSVQNNSVFSQHSPQRNSLTQIPESITTDDNELLQEQTTISTNQDIDMNTITEANDTIIDDTIIEDTIIEDTISDDEDSDMEDISRRSHFGKRHRQFNFNFDTNTLGISSPVTRQLIQIPILDILDNTIPINYGTGSDDIVYRISQTQDVTKYNYCAGYCEGDIDYDLGTNKFPFGRKTGHNGANNKDWKICEQGCHGGFVCDNYICPGKDVCDNIPYVEIAPRTKSIWEQSL